MIRQRLFLFGAPRLEVDGRAHPLERRKALALIAYLAVTARPHTRDHLAALLWPDYEPSSAYAYLRNGLWALNKALGDSWATLEGDTIALRADADLSCDVSDFEAALRVPATDSAARLIALRRAVDLYTDDFMAGFNVPDTAPFTDWQMVMVEYYRGRLTLALAALTDAYAEAGEFEEAITIGRMWLFREPLSEPAHRQLMRLYTDSGQRAAALTAYQELARRLEREYKAAPEPETTALYTAIQQNAYARRTPRSAPVPPPPSSAEAVTLPPELEPARAAPPPPRPDRTETRPTETRLERPTPLPAPALPIPATPFVGRTLEREQIIAQISDPACRLLTIIGPGGMGKTRLALEVGRVMAERRATLPDGVYFVPLAPLSGAELVLSTIAENLAFGGDQRLAPERRLHETLKGRQLLLILDNFEHVLDGAESLSRLLAAAPGVKILVTSREQLNVQEEWLYEISGLRYPANGATAPADSDTFDAVTLFLGSAMRLRRGYTPSQADFAHITRICQLVRGMPLGLELAAGWIPILSPAEIADEIQRNIDFLSTPTRNVPERHRSLRAVFEYSWGSMSGAEQHCLAALSVFRGGATLEAAAVIAGATPPLLRSLTGKSMVRRTESGRLEIHELLRQFGEQKLAEIGAGAARARHLAYYADYAVRMEKQLKGADQAAAIEGIRVEIDNLRHAWEYGIETRDYPALLRMVDGLFLFFLIRDRFDDGAANLATTIQHLNPDSATPEERLLLGAVMAYWSMCNAHRATLPETQALAHRALSLLLAFADDPRTVIPRLVGATMTRSVGRISDESQQVIAEATALAEQHNDAWAAAYGWFFHAAGMHMQMRYAEALELLVQVLGRFEALGNAWGQINVLWSIVESLETMGDYRAVHDKIDQIAALYEQLNLHRQAEYVRRSMNYGRDETHDRLPVLLQNLAEYRQAGDRRSATWTLYHLAWIALHDGRLDEAKRYYTEALTEFHGFQDDEGIIWSNVFLAQTALQQRNFAAIAGHLETARQRMAHLHFPWGEAGAVYVEGDWALALNDLPLAERRYKEAIRIAHGAQSVMQTVRHLSGIAEVMAKRREFTAALILATFCNRHRAAWADTQQRTAKLISHLREHLTATEAAEAEAQASALTLEGVVTVILG